MITERKALRFFEECDCRLVTEALDPVGEDEIQCKSLYSVLSMGSELISYGRKFSPSMHRNSELGHPHCSGYSGVGEVIDVGKNVKGYNVGDIVYTHAFHMQYYNVNPKYGFAYKMPEWMKPEEICWMTTLRCGMFSIMKLNPKVTDTLLIAGLGMFGIAALQFARLCGARRVIVVDPLEKRCNRAKGFGATHVIQAEMKDAVEEIRALTDGRLVDGAVDATNLPYALNHVCAATREGGNVTVISDPADADSMIYPDRGRGAYLTITGIFIDMMSTRGFGLPGINPFYPTTIDDVHATICEGVRDERINIHDMITRKISPADANEVYSSLQKNREDDLGIVFDWSKV
jgi:Threonine dehydrogenase and related Zn-dependent dehydrogenases